MEEAVEESMDMVLKGCGKQTASLRSTDRPNPFHSFPALVTETRKRYVSRLYSVVYEDESGFPQDLLLSTTMLYFPFVY